MTFFISQSTEDDGSRLLDNAEFTWVLRSDWNWDTYEYEKSIELQDEAGATVSFYDTDPTLPVFRNYSEENTVTLDEPLTVRVETDDPSLDNREFKIEFNCLNYDRKVTFTTSGHEINYGFDKFTYSEIFEFEIKLVAEDDLICEDTYIYHIPVESDTDTDELLIVDPYLTKDEDEVSEAVFHVTKKGGETPDPDDELLKEIEQKKKEYDDAFAALEAAQAELEEAENALSAAESDLNDAKAHQAEKASAVTAAQDALDAKDAKIAKKTKEYNDAAAAKEAAQAEYDKAQKEYEDLKAAQGGSGREALEEQKAEAEKAVTAAQAQINKGSLGYFEANGSTKAVEIINEQLLENRNCSPNGEGELYTCPAFTKYRSEADGQAQPTYNLGMTGDATSLENMKVAISMIPTGNKLRVNDEIFKGLQNLNVNDTLMAIAQVQCNASRFAVFHSQMYNTAENLSWGTSTPYYGWYNEEKAIYKGGNHEFEDTGHYQNIVGTGFTNTGYGYANGPVTLPDGTKVNPKYRRTDSQEFSGGRYWETDYNDPTTKSVEEYETHFLAYYEKVHKDLDDAEAEVERIQKLLDEYDAGNDPVEVARKAAEEKRQELEAAEAAEAAAKSTMEAEQAEREALVTNLQNAQKEKEAADKTVSEKQDAYDAAQEKVNAAQEKVNAAQALVNEKLAAYEEAAAKLIKVTDIQIATSSITMHYNETGTLTATVIPEDAYVKSVSWESSNPSVVTITDTESGSYHAVGEGDAELTVRSNESGSDISKTVSVHVNAPEISGFEEISHQYVDSGNEPEYPEKVTAIYEDGTEKEVSVIWEKLNKDQYGIREGSEFTVTGTVEGTALKPEFKVTVNPATVVSTYLGVEKVRTKEGVYPKLPATAEITWSNGDHSAADVEWEEIFEDDYAEAGEFTAHGLAKVSETASVPVEIEVEVYEVTITSIDDPEMITVPSGTEPAYPAKVHVYYNDNSESDVPVTWKKLSKEEYSIREGKTYTVNGAVEGFHGEAELKIVVNPAEIESIKELEPVRTKINVAPELPAKAEVKWTNGEVSEEDIHWNEIPEKSYAKEGTFKAEGYVENAKYEEVPVSVQVTVFVPKIVSFEELSAITVPSGTEPQYPENVTAKYDDETSAEVSVEWEKLTKAQYGLRKGGEFSIKGTVKGTDEKPELTIIVEPAEPKGFEEGEYLLEAGLVITTGMKPSEVLPAEIRVEWTNGDVTKERVTWGEGASDVQIQPGGVTVHGTITISDGREYNVRTHVGVNLAGNWHVDPGDVTKEDAAQVNYNIPEGLWAARDQKTLIYNGTNQTFDFRVYNGNRLLVNKKDYTFKYSNNKNAGVHDLEAGAELNWKPAKKENKPYITITGKGNYSGKIYVPFDILPVMEELTTVPSITVKYNKKVQKPSPAVMYERTTLKKGTDYTLTYFDLATNAETTAPKEPGSYVIHVRGIGNYAESSADIPMVIEDTSAIESKMLASGFNVKVPNVKYEDIQDKEAGLTVEELKDLVKVTYGKNKEEVAYGFGYELEVANAKSVGKATLYVKGINGYTGTKTVTFSIIGVPIKNATSLNVTSQPYTGKEIKIDPDEALTNKNLVEGKDYELVYTNNINAGKATVTLKGKGNYTGSIKKTFTILPVPFDSTFSVSAEDAVYVKGGAKPAVTVMHGDVKLNQGTDYTVKYSGNKKPGEGTVTVTGKGNYKGTLKTTFAVKSASLANAHVTAPDKVSAAKMYSAVTLTDSDGKKLKAGTDYVKPSNSSYTYVNDTILTNGEIRKAGYPVQPKDIAPAGTWIRVTVIGKGNYTGSAVGEYRILAKNYDLSKAKVQFVKDGKTVKSLSKEYTGREVKLEKSELVVKVGGVELEADDYVILGYTNNVNKGTATVTIAGKGGYGGTKTVKFKIGAEKMTVWETLAGLFGN